MNRRRRKHLALFAGGVSLLPVVACSACRGRTALHDAIQEGRYQTVNLLLQHGAEANRMGPCGFTVLMFAVAYSTPEVTHLLMHGAAPNIKSLSGETALYRALLSRDAASLIPDLVSHGADSNLRGNSGLTLLQEVQLCGRPDLVALLRNAGEKK